MTLGSLSTTEAISVALGFSSTKSSSPGLWGREMETGDKVMQHLLCSQGWCCAKHLTYADSLTLRHDPQGRC